MEPNSKFAVFNRNRFHYLEWGGAPPAVVLVHATGFCGGVWGPVATEIAKRTNRRVLAIDLRGHGDSDINPTTSVTWGMLGQDLDGLLEALDLRDVTLVGHSRGGSAAILSMGFPGSFRTTRMILLEPSILIEAGAPHTQPMIEGALRRRQFFPSRDEAFRSYFGRGPFRGWREDVLWAYLDHGLKDSLAGQLELKCSPQTEAAFYAAPMDVDQWDCVANMNFPVAVLRGADSVPFHFDTETFRRFLDTIPVVCQTEDIPGAGHFLVMEKPDAVTEAILRYC